VPISCWLVAEANKSSPNYAVFYWSSRLKVRGRHHMSASRPLGNNTQNVIVTRVSVFERLVCGYGQNGLQSPNTGLVRYQLLGQMLARLALNLCHLQQVLKSNDQQPFPNVVKQRVIMALPKSGLARSPQGFSMRSENASSSCCQASGSRTTANTLHVGFDKNGMSIS
jgi:hypothetical protein